MYRFRFLHTVKFPCVIAVVMIHSTAVKKIVEWMSTGNKTELGIVFDYPPILFQPVCIYEERTIIPKKWKGATLSLLFTFA